VEHRAVWFAVPGTQPGTVLVDAAGELPFLAFDIDEGTTTVGALQRRVLPELGLGGPVLDCMLDVPGDWTAESVVHGFVELEPLAADAERPAGWRQAPLGDVATEVTPGLQPRLAQWIEQQLGTRPPDPLLPAWSRRGWHGAATAWIDEVLSAAGIGPVKQVEQRRAWGISTVLSATAADGDVYWFKAVCEHFRREVPITAYLHAVMPGTVAPVVGSDEEAGWLLLGDIGGGAGATTDQADSDASAYAALRRLQRAVAGRRSELLAAGAALRPLSELPDQLAEALADPVVRPFHDASPERAAELVAWVADRLPEVAALELPDVLIHGDFHPGNVATGGDGERVIFDWSDAAIAAPFLDVPTWLTWLDDDPDGRTRVWCSFAAQWTDVLSVDEWLAWRPVLEGVAGAYHVVSYARIVRTTDELRRPEHGRGVGEFYGFLDAAAR